MSDTVKKFIKYLIIFALLGTVVFFGVKLLFPTPEPTLAFYSSQQVLENENFEKNNLASANFISKYENQFDEELEKIDLLLHSKKVISLQLEVLEYMSNEFAFAKNSSIYNSNAKKLEKLEKELSSSLKNSIAYIETYFEPVYNQPTSPSKSTLRNLLENLVTNNKVIADKLTTYTETITTIFLDLETNFLVNAYSKKNIHIISVWLSNQNDFLNKNLENLEYNSTKGMSNLNKLISFKNRLLTVENSFSYNTNKNIIDEQLQQLTKADIKGFTKALEIIDINNFINSLESQEIKTSTQALKLYILEEN